MACDLSSPHPRMLATFLPGIAGFERDLISEQVKSGLAAAKARGKSSAGRPDSAPNQIGSRRK
ncbi:recombinase family protein [Agrobacterium tumefaciens]|uniref:recombinase family protein n=1 Tax=Agrobacterium tumefaciens TaxID=358 RepID=UPI002350A08A|nr:recombinase family protein [Agrobacterium tumefaciens]